MPHYGDFQLVFNLLLLVYGEKENGNSGKTCASSTHFCLRDLQEGLGVECSQPSFNEDRLL